jgi:hypothetical protein
MELSCHPFVVVVGTVGRGADQIFPASGGGQSEAWITIFVFEYT